MTEPLAAGEVGAPATVASAGALLRAARERQGLPISALAAAIKVSPQRLEALEADRLDELPDLTFARALAQTVCRALKTDPQPVLALLPAVGDAVGLERVAAGLNTPFVGRPGRDDPPPTTLRWMRPAVWVPALALLVAALIYLTPDEGVPDALAPAADPGAPASMAPVSEEPTAAFEGDPLPDPSLPAAAGTGLDDAAARLAAGDTARLAPAADPPSAAVAAVGLRATEPSWVEIRDGAGRVLLARTLRAGESLSLESGLPLRLTVGNAAATTVSLRGREVDLAAVARDNVARLTLE